MKTMTVRKVTAVTRLLAGMALTAPALAEESTEDLAKQTQNPVADLISVPFQNNTNFNVGPLNKDANVSHTQVMLALLAANPEAFTTPCNVNSPLRVGVLLTIPAVAQVLTFGIWIRPICAA